MVTLCLAAMQLCSVFPDQVVAKALGTKTLKPLFFSRLLFGTLVAASEAGPAADQENEWADADEEGAPAPAAAEAIGGNAGESKSDPATSAATVASPVKILRVQLRRSEVRMILEFLAQDPVPDQCFEDRSRVAYLSAVESTQLDPRVARGGRT
jgi:hypothetical protein